MSTIGVRELARQRKLDHQRIQLKKASADHPPWPPVVYVLPVDSEEFEDFVLPTHPSSSMV